MSEPLTHLWQRAAIIERKHPTEGKLRHELLVMREVLNFGEPRNFTQLARCQC